MHSTNFLHLGYIFGTVLVLRISGLTVHYDIGCRVLSANYKCNKFLPIVLYNILIASKVSNSKSTFLMFCFTKFLCLFCEINEVSINFTKHIRMSNRYIYNIYVNHTPIHNYEMTKKINYTSVIIDVLINKVCSVR